MGFSSLTLSLLGMTLLADARLFGEELNIQAGEKNENSVKGPPISKSRLRNLFVRNIQSVRTNFMRTLERCETTTAPTAAKVEVVKVTPSPTNPPTSRTWDQVGSDLNGAAGEEVGQNVQLDETGTLLLVTGVSLIKMYKSGVDQFNVRSWVLSKDLSSEFTGPYLSAGLARNGEALVVGDPDDGNGKARVFALENSTWILKVTFGGVNADDEFGFSVGIVEDGQRIVVGAPGGNYCKLFDILGEGIFWTLVLDGYTNGFGKSLTISQDGGYLGVGAYDSTDVVGSVYVYELTNFYVIQRFDGNIRTTSQGYSFGSSVAMNDDGTVLAIGSYEEDSVQFLRYNPSRNQYDEIGPAAVGETGFNFGRSVALSSSGESAIIGIPGYTKDAVKTGRAEAYSLTEDAWNFIGGYLGEAANDEYGGAVAFSGDGNMLAVGGAKNAGGGADAGHVRAYSLLY